MSHQQGSQNREVSNSPDLKGRRRLSRLRETLATEEVYLEEVIPAPEFGGTFIHPADLRRVGPELTARF